MPGAIIAAVTPLLPLVAGLLALVAGVARAALVRAALPRRPPARVDAEVSVAEALALGDGPARYVRVGGRIDAEDKFEDDAHRPLVLRRTRLQLRDGRDWRTVEDGARPSRSRSATASTGSPSTPTPSTTASSSCRANRSGPRPTRRTGCPRGRVPETPVRLLIEQVSSVDHAIVLGVPPPARPACRG